MVKTIEAEQFVCTECGHHTGKWMGFCAQCRSQGTLAAAPTATSAVAVAALGSISRSGVARLTSGLGELDRTLGGGFVPGAAVVLGGEPGVGKSTMILQVAGSIAVAGHGVLVASAEESAEQVALRSRRISGRYETVDILATNDVDYIVSAAERVSPSLLVVDSIQTVATRDVDGFAGGVGQVRECGARLVSFAKRSGIPVVMIGHVTKEGNLAGPRTLEHVVDVVLYLEGDAHSGLRFVRGLKNRFGATPSLGFFEMGDSGLREVTDPAGVIRAGRGPTVPGSVLFPAVEGRRPLMVEVQALVATAGAGPPRRSVKGVESARLHQVLAALDRHAGVDVGRHDVYVAVAGGVRVREPAADLAVALAVASSHLDVPLRATAAWGEVGLTGELRSVSSHDQRMAEASRLGVASTIAAGPGLPLLADAVAVCGLVPRDAGKGRGR